MPFKFNPFTGKLDSAGAGFNLPATIHAATSKATPVDADELAVSDSAASFGLKKLTWANLKATLKSYFDTLYAAVGAGGGVTAITAVKTDTFTTTVTNGTWADVTDLSVTITPSSSSKRVMIFVSLAADSAAQSAFRVMRDATPIEVATSVSSRVAATGMWPGSSGAVCLSIGRTIVDAPATGSPVTYKVQVTTLTGGGNNTCYINRSSGDGDNNTIARGTSSITVMEVT